LLSFVRSFLKDSPNSIWMLSEQSIRLILNLIVSVVIARSYGPEEWGYYSFIISIQFLIISIAKMGLDTVSIKEFSENKNNLKIALGTVFRIIMILSFIAFSILSLAVLLFEQNEIVQVGILIICLSVFFAPIYTLDYFYQSQKKAKISSVAKAFVILISTGLKIYFSIFSYDLNYIFLSFVIEYLLLSIILAISLLKTNATLVNFFRYFDLKLAKNLLIIASPIIISIFFNFLLTRFDQFMIRYFLDFEDLGIYSAALKIYESWMVFPIILSLSILPILTKERKSDFFKYKTLFVRFMRIGLWSCIAFALIVSLLSEEIINLLFGEVYFDASAVLSILVWASIFSCMSTFSDRYFLIEKQQGKILSRAIIATLLNIILNILLIPELGINGAAYATLIALIISRFTIDFFDKDAKELFKFKLKALGIF